MNHSRSLRSIGLILGGALAAASLFTVPQYASSAYREGDTVQGAIVYEQKTPSKFEPVRISSRLFPANDDCAAAKLDVWLDRGLLTYSLFNNPDPGAPPAESADVSGKTTMLIGGNNCRIRIVVERADDLGGSK